MSDVALRPRSVVEILDATVQLFRSYFTTILTVGAVALLPWFVLQLVLAATTGYAGGLTTTPGAIPTPGAATAQFFGMIGMWIGFTLMTGAVIRVSADAYLGTAPDIGAALSSTLRRLGKLIAVAFLKGFAIFLPVMIIGIVAAVMIPKAAASGGGSALVAPIGLAIIVAIVLAAYLMARFIVAEAVVVLENRGASAAITRSGVLTRGRIGPIIGTLFLAGIIYMLFGLGIGAVSAIMRSPFASALMMDVFMVLVYPLYAILTMLLYYDGRVRNEAFDLEMMTQSLDASVPPGTMSAAAPAGTPTAP